MPLGLITKDSMLNLAEYASKYEEAEGSVRKLEYDEDDREKMMKLATGEIHDAYGNNDHVDEKKSTEGSPWEEEENGTGSVGFTNQEPAPIVVVSSYSKTEEDDKLSTASTDDSISSEPATAAAKKAVAATSLASTPPTSTASYEQYSGFSMDYHGYDYYQDHAAYTSYAENQQLILGKKEQKGFWSCLFPWMNNNAIKDGEEDHDEDLASKGSLMSISEVEGTSPSRSLSREDDELSTSSEMFGEKLSDKDRQAVLARLRLGQPDLVTNRGADTGDALDPDQQDQTHDPTRKGLLNGIVSSEGDTQPSEKRPLRGIMRRTSRMSRQGLDKIGQSPQSNNSVNGDQQRRRSLFPSYESQKKQSKNLHCQFAPMARVTTVKSQKDMSSFEKAEMWWQKSDYEEFRKTGKMITRAMLEGGSEIWLATNRSWQLPDQGRATTLQHAYSLAESQAAFKKGDLKAKKEYEDARDKWWHKFGHSRRGLEHVASIDEGRQRQVNVRAAIKAVVDEQRRQKVFHREDIEKLRMVSIQHTSWARDLARASGASDEDAVTQEFDEDHRKSREFYLLKFSRANQLSGASVKKPNLPAFMRPAYPMSFAPNRLDVNTVSQIRYRQVQNKKKATASSPKATAPSSTKATAVSEEPAAKTPHSMSMQAAEVEVSIKRESMAKKAQGFASGEEVANMSAILTGMGAMPKEAVGVGGP